ncbi:MAG: WD40 repeat domain-containing protein [Pirellulales bacterium]
MRQFELAETLLHVEFHPHGDLLAGIGRSGKVELRDAETGEVRGPRAERPAASTAAFRPDGRQLFLGHHDGTAILWELDALVSTQS